MSRVNADNRYHLRAFCHTRQQGRDFVLSRIQEAKQSAEDWIPEEYDLEWWRQETLRFYPNPAVPGETLATLRHAYALRDGEGETHVRSLEAHAGRPNRPKGSVKRASSAPADASALTDETRLLLPKPRPSQTGRV